MLATTGSRSVTVDAMVALARQGELLLPVLPDRRESLVSGCRVSKVCLTC